jgi:sugar/nucleoside kinase (ribokinase family)
MSVLVVGGTGIDIMVPVPQLPLVAAVAQAEQGATVAQAEQGATVAQAEQGATVDSLAEQAATVDSLAPTGPIRDRVANTGTGVVLGLRALGVAVRMVDALGDDDGGRAIAAAFTGWGVPLRSVTAPAGTRRSVNLVGPDGRRLSFYDAREEPGFRLPPEVYRPELARARHAHLTIMDWARHVLPDLRAAGLSVSTDLHDWDGENPYHIDFALGADLVFLSGVALGGRGPEVAGRILATGVASHVVVTAGAAGADLTTRHGSTHEPAADPRAPVVDTNGAGDAFVAAFLAAHLTGLGDAACLRRAAIAGAYACTRPVGPDGFIDTPTLNQRSRDE